MTDVFLTLNIGSSSLKFRVFECQTLNLLIKGSVSDIGSLPVFECEQARVELDLSADVNTALERVFEMFASRSQWRLKGAGHRVVCGGTIFTKPVRIDDAVLKKLSAFNDMIPLHQPYNIAGIEAVKALYPKLPQIACFDTMFHATMPEVHHTYALPEAVRAKGVRKFGFHGLSYEWIAGVLRQAHPLHKRVVVAHLGSGASLCGLIDGQSIDTSMGMTALAGVPMGTRSGSIDPAIVFYMQRAMGLSAEAVETMLYRESGLKGLSEISNDMKALQESADPRAAFAIEHFCAHVAGEVARLSASIGGLDALVFTGGIGENSEAVREKITERLSYMPEFETLMIPTNEERVIAQHMQVVLGSSWVRKIGDKIGGLFRS